MLSWFSRNIPKPPNPPPSRPDGVEQQASTAVAPLTVPGEKPSSQDPTHLTVPHAQQAVYDKSPVATNPTSEQQQKSTFTAAVSTPHDAVLAEVQGHHAFNDPSARTEATPSPEALGMQSIDTLPAAASDAVDSIATTSSSQPEALHDSFTGAAIGFLSPSSSAKKGGDELWAHMARIRSLQADVARLHLTMEGIGLHESVVPHSPRQGPRAVGERLEDDDEISDADGGSEAERRRAREFERSERRFDGRKEEIGQIMSKLDELSQALASFHTLDAPMFNSGAAVSRSSMVSTTPPRHPTLRRIFSDGPPSGREEFFDSPASIQGPLPIPEDKESRTEPGQSDAPMP
ncbi:hypothetical protein F5148DRAFT_1162233 [Russula earlei]|uniref:Uncharacterized protein n=1 Tax=Russula earlei TaxID=71964 RepID=A0ACC0UMR2_9AGAM|nr:hypothetical protein F5148DRAFT_1162233 [Russula earlei]